MEYAKAWAAGIAQGRVAELFGEAMAYEDWKR
jgi:hypothetical protein